MPILGGKGGNPPAAVAVAVSIPPPINALPAGNFSSTDTKAGASVATVISAADESDDGAMADEFWGVLTVVEGDGRDARVGEARRSEERWDWVITEVWG